MKQEFFTYSNLSNTIINNASKDYTEFLLMQIVKESKKQVIFINEGFSTERLLKNLAFLGLENAIFLSDFSEGIYNFSSINPAKSAFFIASIHQILEEDWKLAVLDYRLLLKKIPPIDFFREKICIQRSSQLSYAGLIIKLLQYGFVRCENVYEVGEIAVRGLLIDIGLLSGFFRIEFDGSKINSITRFNAETQRKEKAESIEEIFILPIKLAILLEEKMDSIKERLYHLALPETEDFLSKIGEFYSLSLHNYLPLFYENTSIITSFFKQDSVFVSSNLLHLRLENFKKEAERNFAEYKSSGHLILPPSIMFEQFSLEKLTSHIQLFEGTAF